MHLKHLCRASDGAGAGKRAHRTGGHAAQSAVLTEHSCIRKSRNPTKSECQVAFELRKFWRRRSWLSSVGRAKAIGRRWRADSRCSQASRRRGIRTRAHSPGTAAERGWSLASGGR